MVLEILIRVHIDLWRSRSDEKVVFRDVDDIFDYLYSDTFVVSELECHVSEFYCRNVNFE